MLFDDLYAQGWHLTFRRFPLHPNWTGDLLFRNRRCLLVLETRRGVDKHTSAHVTADLLGPGAARWGMQLYYGHLSMGKIQGLYRWRRKDHIPTIFM